MFRTARRVGGWVVTRASLLSLRARLLLGLVLVAAAGFVVADFVTYGQINAYLNSQANSQANAELREIHGPQQQYALDTTTHQVTILRGLPSINYVEVVHLDGEFMGSTEGSKLKLAIPSSVIASVVNNQSVVNGAPSQILFTTSAATGSGEFRAAAELSDLSFTEPVIVVVAISLSGLKGTLHQLVIVELAVSAGILVLLGLLGYAVVRIGLRPLAAIEETAEMIAAGDLTRRVERADDTTEVGRLGHSLNVMLARIEHAFSVQRSSEQRLRQFLSDASHELRTPVTSIRGYAELFRRGAANRPEDLARSMRRIEDEAVRMGVLVDDLLLLARLDEGRALQSEAVDLGAVVADAAADAQARAPDRVIAVHQVSSLVIEGDESQLRQVVTNLLQNALRHTPPATPIEVELASSGANAVLRVVDHGEGIAPEHVAHIFERFYRADASRTRDSGGAGLGLAIVASITASHGGRYAVEATAGGGATFVIELPRARADASSLQSGERATRAVESFHAPEAGEAAAAEGAPAEGDGALPDVVTGPRP